MIVFRGKFRDLMHKALPKGGLELPPSPNAAQVFGDAMQIHEHSRENTRCKCGLRRNRCSVGLHGVLLIDDDQSVGQFLSCANQLQDTCKSNGVRPDSGNNTCYALFFLLSPLKGYGLTKVALHF